MIQRLTYDEWRARGYHVKAGSKMVGRNSAGVAVFSTSQVEPNTPKPYTNRRHRQSFSASKYGWPGGLNLCDFDLMDMPCD